MKSEDTKNKSFETVFSGDLSFVYSDKQEKSPQVESTSVKVYTDNDESSAEKGIPRTRLFFSVFFTLLFLITGSSLVAGLLMKKSPNQGISFIVPGDPDSSASDTEAPASSPSSNNFQTLPTNDDSADMNGDVYPVGAPSFISRTTPAPSLAPSLSPILSPTHLPTTYPSTGPSSTGTIVIYALGDLPYSDEEAVGLEKMMDNVPSDADLVIHVGDIRLARGRTTCHRSEYESVRDLFRRSHAPVLLVMGDNEWNDCSNVDEGYQYWTDTFVDFEKEWYSTPQLQRWSQYPESFHFTMRGVLFVGLNLVGGLVHDAKEWKTRLDYQYTLTRDLILEYWKDHGDAAKVVIIGHCDPTVHHRHFFHPFTNFVNVELENRIPILYLNGDQHVWDLRYNYLGASGLMRVMVVGGSIEAPARIEINTQEETSDPRLAFAVQRNSYPFGR